MSILDKLIVKEEKQDSDLITSLKMLFDEQNIEAKTILTNRQVLALTLMNWAGQVYSIDFLNNFVRNYIKYRISGDKGRGRRDLIEIAKAISELEKTEIKKDDSLEKFIRG